MGRNVLMISIVVLSLLIASTSAAEDLILNGGFESGDLAPWEKVGDDSSGRVSDEEVLEGMYSGYVEGTDQLRQSFEPRLGSKFEVFSLAVKTAAASYTYVTLEIHYADSFGPTVVTVRVPTPDTWHSFDFLDRIDPSREVCAIVLTGHRGGISAEEKRTWFDAVTLQNNSEEDPVDPIGSDETERISADLKKLRVKFDLKRAKTRLAITLLAEEVPEGIESGPVDIRVQLTQGDLTTEFDATAELVEVPHKKDHIIRFMDESSANKTP